MALITLAIRGLLDQQIALRTGGLYWATVDQAPDAKILTRQFIDALPLQSPATLISCANTPQSIISDLAPDRGPTKLKLFEIAQNEVEQALATLTRDLNRAAISPACQIVLVAPASSWGNKISAHRLGQWLKRLRAWLMERQATLLVVTHGDALALHTELLQFNETLSGLAACIGTTERSVINCIFGITR
nr:BcsE family c-di-GMP-binding protein [Pseudomonas lundensis]